MGATPHRWAQAASERRRSGLSPAATSKAAAVSMPTPKSPSIFGAVAEHELVEQLIDSSGLFFKGEDATSQAGERNLGGLENRVASGSRAHGGRLGRERFDGQTFQATSQLVRGGVAQLAHLVDGPQTSVAGRALGHEQRPDGLDVSVPGLRCAGCSPREHGAGRLHGIGGVRLTLRPPELAIRAVDLDYVDSCSSQEPPQPAP